MTLDPSLEQKIVESKAQNSSGEIFSALEPALHSAWIRTLGKSVRSVHDHGYFPVILTSYQARYLVKTALERELPEVAVLSVAEIAQDYKVESVGVIALEQEQ
jgi:flagellar biosynthesis protein FlhA